MLTSNVFKIVFGLGFIRSAVADNGCSTSPGPKVPHWKNFTRGGGSGDVIVRDVVVLGGGATGTFAALKLKDANKTVVVVEQQDRMGGHTQTYHDPFTGETVDCGVVIYQNLSQVTWIFGRYNISLSTINPTASSLTISNADFTTGKSLNLTSGSSSATALAIEEYYEILSTNYSYLASGFPLPYPVPQDLLIPFSAFAEKYGLEAAVPTIATFCQGFGDILNLPAIYVFKYFSPNLIGDLSTGFLTTTKSDNSLLYEAATTELGVGNDVLLNTRILYVDRSNPAYVEILVSTYTGVRTIRAKQLVSTIPPLLSNLQSFDLDDTEKGIFGQFNSKGYYTALMRNIGLPASIEFNNVDPSTPPFDLAQLPGIYNIEASGVPNLTHVFYGSDTPLSSEFVKSDILATIARLKDNDPQASAGGTNISTAAVSTASEPEYAFFSAHIPFLLTVNPDAIAGGFYADLMALQGKRNTWWSGAAFDTHSSGPLWNLTEQIVKQVLAAS